MHVCVLVCDMPVLHIVHRLVPLEKIDLRLVQIMYTTGDMAAIRAISPFDISDAANAIDLPWLNEQVCACVHVCARAGAASWCSGGVC